MSNVNDNLPTVLTTGAKAEATAMIKAKTKRARIMVTNSEVQIDEIVRSEGRQYSTPIRGQKPIVAVQKTPCCLLTTYAGERHPSSTLIALNPDLC